MWSIFLYPTENPEDIHPYATFVLPEVSCGDRNEQLQEYAAPKDAKAIINVRNPCQEGISAELDGSNRVDVRSGNMGTIANFDMLMLHENSTLPLSDACSKSVSVSVS